MEKKLLRALLLGIVAAVAVYNTVNDDEPEASVLDDEHGSLTDAVFALDDRIAALAKQAESDFENLPEGTGRKKRKKLRLKADSLHLASAKLQSVQNHIDDALGF